MPDWNWAIGEPDTCFYTFILVGNNMCQFLKRECTTLRLCIPSKEKATGSWSYQTWAGKAHYNVIFNLCIHFNEVPDAEWEPSRAGYPDEELNSWVIPWHLLYSLDITFLVTISNRFLFTKRRISSKIFCISETFGLCLKFIDLQKFFYLIFPKAQEK